MPKHPDIDLTSDEGILEEARKSVAEEAARRTKLPPEEQKELKARDEEALKFMAGSGVPRELVLAMTALTWDPTKQEAGSPSHLPPDLADALKSMKEGAKKAHATPDHPYAGPSTVEIRREGNNLIINITGEKDHVQVVTLPGELAGRQKTPGELAATEDIYTAGARGGGGYYGADPAVSDQFKLTPNAPPPEKSHNTPKR